MTDFLRVSKMAESIGDKYFEATRDAQANRERETRAVVCIQRSYRGFSDRRYIARLDAAANLIQNVYRGHAARKFTASLRRQRVLDEERRYFDMMATKIQKIQRGRLSRRHVHDFYKRKQYIQQLAVQTVKLQHEIRADAERVDEVRRQQQHDKTMRDFGKMTRNMHHLVSTRSQTGVFSSKFGPEYDTTAFGVPLEAHIQQAFTEEHRRKKSERAVLARTRRLQKKALQRQQGEVARDAQRSLDETVPALQNVPQPMCV